MKKLQLLGLFCLFALVAFAQNRTITGKITNPDGIPVSFASVTVKGTTKGVSSDVNGNFSIDVARNSILLITAAGYQNIEVNVGDQTVINSMLTAENTLGEVVVTALGISKAQKSLG